MTCMNTGEFRISEKDKAYLTELLHEQCCARKPYRTPVSHRKPYGNILIIIAKTSAEYIYPSGFVHPVGTRSEGQIFIG